MVKQFVARESGREARRDPVTERAGARRAARAALGGPACCPTPSRSPPTRARALAVLRSPSASDISRLNALSCRELLTCALLLVTSQHRARKTFIDARARTATARKHESEWSRSCSSSRPGSPSTRCIDAVARARAEDAAVSPRAHAVPGGAPSRRRRRASVARAATPRAAGFDAAPARAGPVAAERRALTWPAPSSSTRNALLVTKLPAVALAVHARLVRRSRSWRSACARSGCRSGQQRLPAGAGRPRATSERWRSPPTAADRRPQRRDARRRACLRRRCWADATTWSGVATKRARLARLLSDGPRELERKLAEEKKLTSTCAARSTRTSPRASPS
jgi:cell division protein FtsL